MAIKMKIAVLLLAVSVHAASAQTFPYCRCSEYRSEASPYVLGLAGSPAETGTEASATFTLTQRSASAPGNPELPCYGILANKGIEKLTIDTNDQCKGNIKVYINGATTKCNTCYVEKKASGQAYIKVPFKPAATIASTPITIKVVGTGPCASLATLLNNAAGTEMKDLVYRYAMFNSHNEQNSVCCPASSGRTGVSPQLFPPPAPSGFPWCQCNKNVADTPFSIKGMTQTMNEMGTKWTVSMTMQSQACEESNFCCNMNFKKVELHIDENCRRAIGNVVVGDSKKSTSFQSYGQGRLVFKVTGNDIPSSSMDGLVIKFDVTKTATCTPDNFFASMRYSLFGSGGYQACCPTQDLPAPMMV